MVSQILIVMIAAIAVTLVAERRGIQAPLLLALVGLAASFIPGLPRLELEPEIILTVVLPPLLFSAASEFSFVSFIRRLGSIVNLGVFLVAVTTAVVGGVAAAVIPGMTLVVALVLGAVVSPPDAVTAVAVARKLKLPSRLMTVLKGESLINDAAALTLFTFATASVAGTRLFIPNLFFYLLYSVVAGILIGVVLSMIVLRIRRRLTNPSLVTVLSVLVPFAAYTLAEELGASGVLAVVAAGFSLGHNASTSNYDARIQERQFWRTADALLEAFVFAYIGLQFRWVLEDAEAKGFDLLRLLGLSALVLLAVIAVRVGWVFATSALAHWRARVNEERLKHPRPPRTARPERESRRPERTGRAGRDRRRELTDKDRETWLALLQPFSWQENIVIAWTGMRGVVTLAAAAGIPLLTATGEAFPGRAAIQVVAFVVTIGTLLLQGLTLPWLIGRLKISDPKEEETKEKEHKLGEDLARQATIDAVTAYRDRQTEEKPRQMADIMLMRVSAQSEGSNQLPEMDSDALQAIAGEIIAARRAALVKARDDRELDDEVMREMLEQMDFEEAVMENWTPGRFGGR